MEVSVLAWRKQSWLKHSFQISYIKNTLVNTKYVRVQVTALHLKNKIFYKIWYVIDLIKILFILRIFLSFLLIIINQNIKEKITTLRGNSLEQSSKQTEENANDIQLKRNSSWNRFVKLISRLFNPHSFWCISEIWSTKVYFQTKCVTIVENRGLPKSYHNKTVMVYI